MAPLTKCSTVPTTGTAEKEGFPGVPQLAVRKGPTNSAEQKSQHGLFLMVEMSKLFASDAKLRLCRAGQELISRSEFTFATVAPRAETPSHTFRRHKLR